MSHQVTQKALFALPKDKIYMCGHSLGPMPLAAKQAVQATLDTWSIEGAMAWNNADWMNLPQQLGDQIARLIGAGKNEVVVADSTTVNLYKVLLSALSLNPNRCIILTDDTNFPADLYIAEGIAKNHIDLQVKHVARHQVMTQMNEEIAVLMLTHVNYRTSERYDMAAITARAHQLGILVVWDLSHSVGAMPLHCSDCDIDFAVGCTYKYLNGGPGAPSFVYINMRHHASASSPIQGWMGHAAPFEFTTEFEPAQGAQAFLGGTPTILSMKALEGALSVYAMLDIQQVRKVSVEYGDFFIEHLNARVPELKCVSPRDAELRGGHVGFTHPEAYAISRILIEEGIIVDYREPNLIRFCLSGVYLDFSEIKSAAELICQVMRSECYLKATYQARSTLT